MIRFAFAIAIAANPTVPIYTPHEGAFFRSGAPRDFFVRDASGNGFYYAHMDAYSPAAREGAAVARGTVLGYVGDTGDARGTPTHLHFEVHPGGGGPVRPYPIVTGWPRAG